MTLRIQQLRRLERIPTSQLTRTLLQSTYPRPILSNSRLVHSSSRQNDSVHSSPPVAAHLLSSANVPPTTPSNPVLCRLPTSNVLRSYLITLISSSPTLLTAIFNILKKMLDSKSALTNIERNPILSLLLKSTFYAQFCAGENKGEVHQTAKVVRDTLGYDGIMLEYGLEVLADEGEAKMPTAAETEKEIEVWKRGMLDSIEMMREGDFVGLKWSGLGRHALHLLQTNQPPTPSMMAAITAACDAAAAKNIALLPGAEEEITNVGLEAWCLDLQKKYNRNGRAIVYTTFQCYLKAVPKRVAALLEHAQKEGFTAGVKLVRGAYMRSEPRELIWEAKEGTNKCYDTCTSALLARSWNDSVMPPSGPKTPFPSADIILATHNLETLKMAQATRQSQLQTSSPESLPRVTYIQLLGMADEISQQLVQSPEKEKDVTAKVVKCMTWGTTTQCLNFLLRRASENKEAAERTGDTRKAMGSELWRRFKGGLGLN
ncbi:carbapenem antibiotics biosynthesis protein card [Massarina eburnea CBS 473.64]|uniref:Proline dehydrogenase n=1 Tax=Massarina eburnea CBS 473.64 TaxID=1395130 RepID=A0A6A6SBA7_9PLEO|nr:carbapenem antibiotics biosynthesis protein card [Massarina eburnea CBS 473.64]